MANKKSAKKINGLFIAVTVILYFFSLYALGFYFESGYRIKQYDFENPVKAVYTDIKESISFSRRGLYDLIYEYTAPDGTFYTGKSNTDYPKSKAESYIGTEVEIYLDGKGDSTTHDYRKDNRLLYLIFGIVFILSGTATIVIPVVLYKRKSKKP